MLLQLPEVGSRLLLPSALVFFLDLRSFPLACQWSLQQPLRSEKVLHFVAELHSAESSQGRRSVAEYLFRPAPSRFDSARSGPAPWAAHQRQSWVYRCVSVDLKSKPALPLTEKPTLAVPRPYG